MRLEPVRRWVERYTLREISDLSKAIIVPLGDVVGVTLQALMRERGMDDRRLLSGLPHPSGANAERIACFMGTKLPEDASSRTDGYALVEARTRLAEQVSAQVEYAGQFAGSDA